jgi:glycine dehydrogenase
VPETEPGFRSADTSNSFVDRHVGLTPSAVGSMLDHLGYPTLDALMDAAIPSAIRTAVPVLPTALSEGAVAAELRSLASLNQPCESMIGLGYHSTVTPPVIRRNLLEDPSWYTAYTPYQPEIAQGRLEGLLNYQTLVADLTGLPVSNASLLDEGTAAAEAITLVRRADRNASGSFVVDHDALPQTIAVVLTRARALGIDVLVTDVEKALPAGPCAGVLIQYPGASGRVWDPRDVIGRVHRQGGMVVMATDPLALTLLESPGTLGADIAVGSSQRLGVPMYYGGPHAAYLAVREGLERQLPGRLVGVSVDASGRPAYRLALQTREQHIRRDKATSNICTAQALLAIAAGMYAVYHGAEGMEAIATRVHRYACELAEGLTHAGYLVEHQHFFDTITVTVPGRAADIVAAARGLGVHLRLVDDDRVGISTSEVTSDSTLALVLEAFGAQDAAIAPRAAGSADVLPAELRRSTPYLTHHVFNAHRSETQMLRYLRRLSNRDYALDRGMIPLGSCTMKLNATTEMEAIGLGGFADVHPFVPAADAAGYHQLIADLEAWLARVTGYDRVSLQPNAGSQGELAGLMAISAFHQANGDAHRDVCLIPASAHGTNAASAILAGMRVVVVNSAKDGSVDLDDLRAKCEAHAGAVAAIMVTYPSTHGVYEDVIAELSEIVHRAGGQVYVDGANLNALVGYAEPGSFGGDVSHLNLHKTFCIPHGGGGPGVGPVAVRAHLAPYLPTHPAHPDPERRDGVGPVSAAPYGSAGILPITWAYLRMMGAPGLARATACAVLSANYVASRLGDSFPVLYRGSSDLVAHECILDLRDLTQQTGVTAEDVAKRLIDYGFHAPTMSFPVPGTLMVEPTESEDLAEIDRFCEAMIAIRGEIERVKSGEWSVEESPLRQAPHTTASVVGEWSRPYSRELAAFPVGQNPDKYWPPVARIDQAYGDRNLACSCPPVSAFDIGAEKHGA